MKKYLLFDRTFVDGHWLNNVKLQINSVTKEGKIFFKEEYFADPPKKWEVRYDNSYPNIIYNEEKGLYQLYYTLFTEDSESEATPLSERVNKQYNPTYDRLTSVCYAESKDGVNWIKPNLGRVMFDGDTNNNILFEHAHGTGVFYDKKEKDPLKRYKLVTKIEYSHENHYMAVGFSEDGINFGKLIPWPNYNPQADTHNFAFRDTINNNFKLITRTWSNGLRIVSMCESNDFINWSQPREVARGIGFEHQIYSMPTFIYNDTYFGLASMYHEGNRSAKNFDKVDCKLMYSTDLNGWEYVDFENSFIPFGQGEYPDGDFDSGCIYAATPVVVDDRLYFYYMGGNGQHTNYRETSFSRAYINKDEFAYYTNCNSKAGYIKTRDFYYHSEDIELLADIEESGYINIIINERGSDFPLFETRLEGVKKRWNSLGLTIEDKAKLRGKNIEFNIEIFSAKLYGIKSGMEFNKRK